MKYLHLFESLWVIGGGGVQLQTNPVSGRWRLKSNLDKRESFLRRAPVHGYYRARARTYVAPGPAHLFRGAGAGAGELGAGDLGGTSTESTKSKGESDLGTVSDHQ